MANIDEDQPIESFKLEWVDSKKGEAHKIINSIIAEWGRSTKQVNMVSAIAGYMTYFNRKRPFKTQNGFINIATLGPSLSPLGQAQRAMHYINLTAMGIDTLTSKLASLEVTPQVNVNMANNKGRQLGEDLNYLLKGIWKQYNLSSMLNAEAKDAMITGKGAIFVEVIDNEVCFTRARLEDFLIDPLDSYYGLPQKLVWRTIQPLHSLIKKYPKFKSELEACKKSSLSTSYSRDNTPMVEITHAWCLNTYLPKGRHVVSIHNADLVDEPYDKDYYPMHFFDYNAPLIGWVGESVTSELEPIQLELNRVTQSIQYILRIVSVPRVFLDSQSDVNVEQLTNIPGEILRYNSAKGIPPTIHNGAAMPPEVINREKDLIEFGLSRIGLTTSDTQGKQLTGSGNQSGEALKTMVDIKSERWRYLEGNFQKAHIALAKLIFKELKGKHINIPVIDRSVGLRHISTKIIPDIEDSYVVDIYPVSSMPDSIADKMDTIERMINLGLINRSQMYDLFKLPDVDAQVAKISAPIRIVDKRLTQITVEKKYYSPEPYYNLDYCLKSAQDTYCWGEINDQDDEIQELLRRFINDTIVLIQERDAQMAMKQQTRPQGNPQATSNQGGVQAPSNQAPQQLMPQGQQ